MVTGEILLNGDGQLHEGDWGGIGEDGDYEAGEGDEEGGHNNSGHHNNSTPVSRICTEVRGKGVKGALGHTGPNCFEDIRETGQTSEENADGSPGHRKVGKSRHMGYKPV